MKTTLFIVLLATGSLLSATPTRDDAKRHQRERAEQLAAKENKLQAEKDRLDAMSSVANDKARQAMAASGAKSEAVKPPQSSGLTSIAAINAHYDAMERKTQLEYQKQLQAAKGEINAMADQIKRIEAQIKHLKAQAEKSEEVAARIAAILEQIEKSQAGKRALQEQIVAKERQITAIADAQQKAVASLNQMRNKAIAAF